MNEKVKIIGSDLKKVDSYILTDSDYDDAPELNDEWFDKAKIYFNGVEIKTVITALQPLENH